MTTLRQLLMTERKFLELHEAIRDNDGVECERLPDFFFPEEPDPKSKKIVIDIAKSVCELCPVRAKCLDYAMSTRVVGIWGGTTPEERYSSS
jgi:hypothetical protein